MKYGLTETEYQFLVENLVEPLEELGAKVFIFGSRATGKHKKFSDIDILYKESSKIQNSKIYQLISFFEESTFPYKIDLVNDCDLAESYREGVERNKIEL